MPEQEILKYFSQIIERIKYYCQKEIIHGDLKSANIILMKDETIKLAILNLPEKCLRSNSNVH
jgi:serine/threonine protein kinase